MSRYSVELANDLMAGALDLAIATEPPESPSLTRVKVSEAPFYIAMSKRHELASHPSISLSMLNNENWFLFERRLHPPIYDKVLRFAASSGANPKSLGHFKVPEEVFPFLSDGTAVAFMVKAGALLLARNGLTVRPLSDESLLLNTYLVSRVDNETRLASELVRAFVRKVSDVKKESQLRLPIAG